MTLEFMNLAMKLLGIVWDFFESIVVALVIFLFCYIFLFQPHKVQGYSMYPTFDDGDYLLTDKLSYRLHEPKAGEVVVFNAPDHPKYDYIKRIIAVPGDRVKLINGKFYVNGYILDESEYLSSEIITQGEGFLKEGGETIIPPNYYFMAGDNRPGSSDSRQFGPVAKDKIVGKAWIRYWPITSMGIIEKVELKTSES